MINHFELDHFDTAALTPERRVEAFLHDDRHIGLLHEHAVTSVSRRVLGGAKMVGLGALGALGSGITVMGIAAGIFFGVGYFNLFWGQFGPIGCGMALILGPAAGLTVGGGIGAIGIGIIVAVGFLIKAHLSNPLTSLKNRLQQQQIDAYDSRRIVEAAGESLKKLQAPILGWSRHSVAESDFLIKYDLQLSTTEKTDLLLHFYHQREIQGSRKSLKSVMRLEDEELKCIHRLRSDPEHAPKQNERESLIQACQRSFAVLKEDPWYQALPDNFLRDINELEGYPALQLFHTRQLIDHAQKQQLSKVNQYLATPCIAESLKVPSKSEVSDYYWKLKQGYLPSYVQLPS